MRSLRTMAIAGAALLAVLLAGAAAAQPSPNVFDGGNRWLITAFDDCSKDHAQWATQGICFLPYQRCSTCAITGIWYSDTYPGWSGRYMQEGDRILMHGNWGNDIGSDGMVIELFAGVSPRDEGGGQWTEWFNGGPHGTTVGFLNTRLRRVGRCPLPQNVDAAKASQPDLEKLVADLSSRVKPRLRKDGKPAASPTDPEQVPLAEEKEYGRP
jgi:hypothetical protein